MTHAAKSKPITRVYDLGERRAIVATFNPSGVVEFREKGRRTVYAAHLRHLFRRAVEQFAQDEKQQRIEARRARRAARA